MTEKEIVALLKSINIKIEALQSQMVMFQEALQPDLEYTTRVEEEVKKPKVKKLPKSTKKIDTGEVYNFMGKEKPYTCNKCGGLISWDLRPERIPPLHVDKNGHMIGVGDCPEWEADQ